MQYFHQYYQGNIVFVLMFSVFMVGCDPMVQAPQIVNEYDSNIEINITLDNGDSHKMRFAPCYVLDSATLDIRNQTHRSVESVLIRKAGVVIHSLGKQQLVAMLNQQKAQLGEAIWSVGPQGIRLIPHNLLRCS